MKRINPVLEGFFEAADVRAMLAAAVIMLPILLAMLVGGLLALIVLGGHPALVLALCAAGGLMLWADHWVCRKLDEAWPHERG